MALLRVIETALILEFMLACLTACSVMLGAASLASLAIAVNIILVVAIFSMAVASSKSIKSLNFGLVLLMFALSFVGIFYNAKNGVSFEYIKKWLMFNCTVMLYYSVCEIPVVTTRVVKAYWGSGVVLTLCMFYMYFTGRHYPIAGGITLNFPNPNFTGICVLSVFLTMFSLYGFVEKRQTKILLIGVLAILAYLIYLTAARACMISALFFIFAVALYRGKYRQWVSWFIVLFPLLFALLYMAVIINASVQEDLAFAESEGKTVTSRFTVWSSAFDDVRENPLLGRYVGQSNLHNTHLDTMAAFGIPVLLFLTAFLASILQNIGRQATKPHQLNAIFGFYAIIISGTFEAAMFSGSQGMYAMAAGLLLVAKYQGQTTVDESVRYGNPAFYRQSFEQRR